jgi:hypothetical protein
MFRKFLPILGYLSGAALVALTTVSLVAYGQGYSYNFATGRIIRTGLVILQSVPNGAAVTFEGKRLGKKTAYRQSLEAGSYEFVLSKDGFKSWSKKLAVRASEVTMVQYALLVPEKLQTSSLLTADGVALQSMSKDHRHLAYVAADGVVYVLDIGKEQPTKLYTPVNETVTEVTWSDDASHLLVVTQAAGGQVHRLVAANNGEAQNLTERFQLALTGLRFSAGDWRQLYWVSADGLRRLDLEAGQASTVLAANVRQFQVAGDRVLYVQNTDLGPTLWSIDGRGHKQELIQALPESESYALAFTSYRGHEELAVVPARTRIGTLYSDIFSSNPIAKTVAHNVTAASFSPDGHLLAFSGPEALVTYDLELSTLTTRLVSYEFAGVAGLHAVTWFDNFHVLRNQGGRLLLSDFDGTNVHDLGELTGAYPAYNTADGRSVMAFRPQPVAGAAGASAGSVQLTQIILKP